jgi:hypothetical protein
MRSVGGVVAALVATATCCCSVENVRADPGGRDRESVLFFAGTDAWGHGYFVHGGLLWSPGGLDAEGFTFKILLNGGLYRYRSGALAGAEVAGRKVAGFLAPGWRFKRDNLTVTLFAGLDLQNHRLSPADPAGRLSGDHVGARLAAELWYQPDAVTMIAADASISTIGGDYSARGAIGWRAFNSFYVGPEVQGLQSGEYGQLRIGAHATAFKTGDLEWSAAAGWALDSDDRSGLYGRLGVIARQ